MRPYGRLLAGIVVTTVIGCNAILDNEPHRLAPPASNGGSAGTNGGADANGGVGAAGVGAGRGGMAGSGGTSTPTAGRDSIGASGEPGSAGEAGAATTCPEAGSSCYDGPASTATEGVCKPGKLMCQTSRTAVCTGQTLPSVERCGGAADGFDENCDGFDTCTGSVRTTGFFPDGTAQATMRVKLDKSGNEYLLGDYYAAFALGSGVALPAADEQGEIFYAKFDASGNAIWAKGLVGGGWQYSRDLVVTDNGELTLSGLYSTKTGETFEIATTPPTELSTPSVGAGSGIIVHVGSDGSPVWVDELVPSSGFGSRDQIALSQAPNGHVYAWVTSDSQITFHQGATTTKPALTFGDASSFESFIYLLDIDSSGKLVGSFAGGYSQLFALGDVITAPDGTIYVAGYHDGTTIDFGNAGQEAVDTTGFILKISPPLAAGGAFRPSWAANVDVIGYYPERLALDSDGNIYLAALSGAGGAVLGKWSSAGGNVWLKLIGNQASTTFQPNGLTIDAANYVTILGTCAGKPDFNPGGASETLTTQGTDLCIAKYQSDGSYLWSEAFGDSATQTGEDLTADPLGNLHIVGTVQGKFNPLNGDAVKNAGISTALLNAVLYP